MFSYLRSEYNKYDLLSKKGSFCAINPVPINLSLENQAQDLHTHYHHDEASTQHIQNFTRHREAFWL